MYKENKEYIVIIAFVTLIFGTLIMKWGLELIHGGAIIPVQESFTMCQTNSNDLGQPDTSHTVNLPINTNFSCRNFCGPPSRCAITGEQCTSDVDCTGCQPKPNPQFTAGPVEVPGYHHAGKILSIMPDYSKLTTDIATDALPYTSGNFSQPPSYYRGLDTWKPNFKVKTELVDSSFYPSIQETGIIPRYPSRYTLSGEFVDDGPLAANIPYT